MNTCCCNHAEAVTFVQSSDMAVLEVMPCVCGARSSAVPTHVACVTKSGRADDYRHHPARFALPWDFVEGWRCLVV